MKQGNRSTLPVTIHGIGADTVEKIEFLFKDVPSSSGDALKKVEYPGDVTVLDTDNTTYLVPFSVEDTYKFKPGMQFFLDTRITLTDVTDQPETPIIPIVMNKTLFAEGD